MSLNSVKVKGSIFGGAGGTSGGIVGNDGVGSVSVGGDIVGGSGDNSGGIGTFGAIDSVKIKGGITGGAGFQSGTIALGLGDLGSASIGGNLVGGSGEQSGGIGAFGDLNKITIKGSIIGGSGVESGGLLSLGGNINTVSIGRDIIGGTGNSSGGLLADEAIGSVKIKGSIIGAGVTGTASIDGTGVISSGTRYRQREPRRLADFRIQQRHGRLGKQRSDHHRRCDRIRLDQGKRGGKLLVSS